MCVFACILQRDDMAADLADAGLQVTGIEPDPDAVAHTSRKVRADLRLGGRQLGYPQGEGVRRHRHAACPRTLHRPESSSHQRRGAIECPGPSDLRSAEQHGAGATSVGRSLDDTRSAAAPALLHRPDPGGILSSRRPGRRIHELRGILATILERLDRHRTSFVGAPDGRSGRAPAEAEAELERPRLADVGRDRARPGRPEIRQRPRARQARDRGLRSGEVNSAGPFLSFAAPRSIPFAYQIAFMASAFNWAESPSVMGWILNFGRKSRTRFAR